MPSPVGHALGGLLAGMGLLPKLDRRAWRDLAICAAAGCLPDIDFLWGRHAMETHSIGAAALAGGVVFAASRRRDLTFACVAAWLSHVVFDWLGSDDYPPLGVMALWPFSSEFYFANAFIFEAISRRYRAPGFWEQNLWALAKEIAMLMPPVAALWWWRRPETRRAMKSGVLVFVVAALIGVPSAFAQQDNPQPSCRNCPGYHIPSGELDAYLKRAMAERIIDQQVRSVDIGKSNVAIGMVHRTKIATPGDVAEHDLVSEVYHVISGSATLVLGPDLVGAERRPATNTNVRLLNGPGHNAKSIRNGVSYELKAGDVVIIPAGTGHWFTRIDDHITYLMVRIDPDKVTPHKDEAASKADLGGKKP